MIYFYAVGIILLITVASLRGFIFLLDVTA